VYTAVLVYFCCRGTEEQLAANVKKSDRLVAEVTLLKVICLYIISRPATMWGPAIVMVRIACLSVTRISLSLSVIELWLL